MGQSTSTDEMVSTKATGGGVDRQSQADAVAKLIVYDENPLQLCISTRELFIFLLTPILRAGDDLMRIGTSSSSSSILRSQVVQWWPRNRSCLASRLGIRRHSFCGKQISSICVAQLGHLRRKKGDFHGLEN